MTQQTRFERHSLSGPELPTTYKEVELCTSQEGNKVRCNLCARRCLLGPGQHGYCSTKINLGGKLYSTTYGVVSTVGADPIEKKPIYHYRPGTKVLTLGGVGCNFRCDFCQNWDVAFANGLHSGGLREPNLVPHQAVSLAVEQSCAGIGWSFNEPSIWLDYVLDCARIARENGLYSVYVTNGYITPEALDVLGPYLDVYRVDIKSLSDTFYAKLAHGAGVRPVLDGVLRAKGTWGLHVEVITNLMPGWNDDDENLHATSSWLTQHLGPDTPWHLTRFVPYAFMRDVPPTPLSSIRRAANIGNSNGLNFIYCDEEAIRGGTSTMCPTCGAVLITRTAFEVHLTPGVEHGKCPSCHALLHLVI